MYMSIHIFTYSHILFQANLKIKIYARILKNMTTIEFYKSVFILRNVKHFRGYLRKYFTIFILHINWALFTIDNFLTYSSGHMLSYIIYLSFNVKFSKNKNKMYKICLICNNFWSTFLF